VNGQHKPGSSAVVAGFSALGDLPWELPVFTSIRAFSTVPVFGATALQFFIAAGMIVLILEEIRVRGEKVRADSAAARLNKILWISK
jgi:hypothetical protein